MGRSYKPGDEPIPGYRLTGFLGRGAFGEVWKASGPGGTVAAIKLINLSGRQGRKEFGALRLVKTIRHPNLVPIVAFWLKDEQGTILEDADEPAAAAAAAARPPRVTPSGPATKSQRRPTELIIAMGLGDQSLYDRLQQCRAEGLPAIPAEELLDYMEGAARAIDFLNSPSHDLGEGPIAIQHCDIKPQNMMIVGGAAQVCDFGLARALQDDIRMTSAAGSPAYGAPELLQGIAPSATTDQYSLAVSYVELRTGELPFHDATSVISVIKAHMEGKLDLSALPAAERTVIQRATDRDPKKRFPTTLDMVRALRRGYESEHAANPALASTPAAETVAVELVPGYKFVRKHSPSYTDEVWEARGPRDLPAVLLVRDLQATEGEVDVEALALLTRVGHDSLDELLGFWLLDQHARVIGHWQGGRYSGPPPNRLVTAHRLPPKNLLRRMQECRRISGRGMPFEELLGSMRQLAAALDYLNTPRRLAADRLVAVIHGNLCPCNFAIHGHRVALSNFGLARLIDRPMATLPASMNPFEHPYVAPEVLDRRITRWTDQCSLAIAYSHLRTGETPFDADSSLTHIMLERQSGALDFSSLSAAEARVIARATAPTPEDRFDNCAEFVRALELAGRSPAAYGSDHPSVTPPAVERGTLSPDAWESGGVQDTLALPDLGAPRPGGAMPKQTGSTSPVHETHIEAVTATPREEARPADERVLESADETLELAGTLSKPGAVSGTPDERRPAGSLSRTKDRAPWRPPVRTRRRWLGAATAVTLALAAGLVYGLRDHIGFKPGAGESEVKKITHADPATDTERSRQSVSGKESSEGPAVKPRPRPRPKLRPSLDAAPELALIEQALLMRNDKPAEALALCDKAWSTLDQAADASRRWQVLLARAALQARQSDWESLFQALPELEQLAPEMAREPQASQQALWFAVRLLASAHDSHTADLDPVQWLDWLIQFDRSYHSILDPDPFTPDEWESARIEEIGGRAIDGALTRAMDRGRSPEEGLALLEKLIEYRPQHFAALVAQGTLLFRQDNLDGSMASFERAWRVAPDEAAGKQVEPVLQALDLLKPVGAKGQAPASLAVDALGALRPALDGLAGLAPDFFLDLLHRLLAQVRADDERLAEFTELLAGQQVALPAAFIKPWHDGLRERIQQLHRAAEPPFDVLRQLADAAIDAGLDDPTVKASLAECLVQSKSLPQSVADRARRLAAEAAQAAPASAYVQLVNAVVARPHDAAGWQAVGDSLSAALKSADEQPEMTPYRLTQAANVLLDAADALETPDRLTVEQNLANPYGTPEAAATVDDWMLSLERQVGGHKPDSVRVQLHIALAACHKEPPDFVRARSAADLLIKSTAEELSNDRYQALLAHARAHAGRASASASSRAAAARSYAELVELALEAEGETDADALALDREVLQPGLRLFEGKADLPDDLKPVQARLLAARGRLIASHKSAEWGLGDATPAQAAFEAYDAALKLDGERARYYVGRGWAQLELAPPELEAAKQDAGRAIELAADDPWGYELLGTVALRLADQHDLDRRLRIESLESAVESWDRAIELSAGQATSRKRREASFINGGKAYTLLANAIPRETQEERKRVQNYLEKSVEYGRRAVEFSVAYRDYAYRIQGNALEDLAWFLGHQDRWQEAEQAFTLAISAAPQEPKGHFDRGRCRVKRVIFGQEQASLSDAAADLEHAIGLDETLHKAHRWLGDLHYHLAKVKQGAESLDEANQGDELFKQAIAVARQQGDVLEEAIYRDALGALQYVYAYQLFHEAVASGAANLLDAARRRAESLDPTDAAYIKGGIHQAQAQWQNALAAYNAVLPEDLAQAEAAHFRLLIARAHCRLLESNTLKSTEALLQNLSKAALDARRAVELAKSSRSDADQLEAQQTSGAVYFRYASLPKDQKPAQVTDWALQGFREADKLADKLYGGKEPAGSVWRIPYIQLLLEKIRSAPSAALKRELIDEASKSLRVARPSVPEQQKAVLDRLQRDIHAEANALN